MPAELVVLGQDPRFGGGSAAQARAFVDAAEALGHPAELLYDRHPGLGEARLTWRRIEGLRQLRAARTLEMQARNAPGLWVVASLAQNGGAAARSRRPYGCWVGTTIRSEWAGRAPGLAPLHRAAAGLSVPALAALERRVLRSAARVFATSPASRADVARAAALPEDEVGVLPIPVDVERLRPAADDAWREALSVPVLTFVGRADDPRKNVPALLEAFTRIRASLPDARLRLVGRPPSGELPPGVEAVGEVADPGVELRRAALFVLPSRQEGFGIVAAEAMACGLPIVTTPSGGPEDLVRRSGAGVVASDLAAAVVSLVRRPDELAEMRRRAREHVEREHAPAAFREALRAALAQVDAAR